MARFVFLFPFLALAGCSQPPSLVDLNKATTPPPDTRASTQNDPAALAKCQNANWRATGYRHGLSGFPMASLRQVTDACEGTGIKVDRHKVMVYTIAGMLAGLSAVVLTSKNLTAQAGMGVMYELDAIAMTVIGGVSLAGGRGSIVGTVLGALIFGVIISGFTFLRLDAYYQEMVKGAIIVAAVVLDQWRQRRAATKS